MNEQLLEKELRRDEGVRYTVYLDTKGIPTVGVGHNLRAHPLPVGWTLPLNDDQVDQLLTFDLQTTYSGLDLHFPWWRTLDDVRMRCVANMCFNMGIETLMQFHNSMGDLQAGNYTMAAMDFEHSLWYHQVGERAVRICNAIRTGEME